MFDTVEKLGHSVIQHGKSNNRIYLMKYDERDQAHIVEQLAELAEKRSYGKIIVKLPGSACEKFLKNGYRKEGEVKGYYRNGESCKMLSRFLNKSRSKTENLPLYREILDTSQKKKRSRLRPLARDYRIAILGEEDSEKIAALYSRVFATYPFPIFDSNYIKETIRSNVVYFGVYYKNELIGLSSGEMNVQQRNAEMTDFAVIPGHRGKSLSKHLLKMMQQEMNKRGIATLYSLARAISLPMNATFAGLGYHYGGTLINNTQISGKIESMNIWVNCSLQE